MELQKETLGSIKKSYFNILALFLANDKIESRYLSCLLKWGIQLQLSPEEVNNAGKGFDQLQFDLPKTKVESIEAIYHLVQMIYLDKVVEDRELEVAGIYAEKLGFKKELVGELFKSIATAVYDGATSQEVRKEVLDFLKVQD